MRVWPLKFRQHGDAILFADDAGGFFRSDEAFLERYIHDRLTPSDLLFLRDNGHAFEEEGDLEHMSFAFRWAGRQGRSGKLDYLILVPTLRCNLACSYCQVSRADERARGYDWDEETIGKVFRLIDGLETDTLKVEFQGGEPLLRVHLLERVREHCRMRFSKVEFVVCTNLQRLGPAEWAFLDAPDTFVSTSIDGNRETHRRQRTVTAERTDEFFGNLREAVDRLGADKVSALPTIDVDDHPDLGSVVDTFAEHGLRSIFLRPVNFQGFARKRHDAHDVAERWNALHARFVDLLIERNAQGGPVVEEYYFVHCLRRVLRLGLDGHVDLRNPNFLGRDYLVVDHDGRLYPTDEARMMTRVGQIDLSIGNLDDGVDKSKLAALNEHATNAFDPDCVHCPYQAFCGVDLIDEISRSGRIDAPKFASDFCRRHISIFDRVFDLIYSTDPDERRSLSLWAGVESFPVELAPVHA